MAKKRIPPRKLPIKSSQIEFGSSFLPSTMIYVSGRLDAADRKATILAGAGLAFLGFVFTRYEEKLLPFSSVQLEYLPILLALFSVLLCGLAIWPQNKAGADWVSKIFLNAHSSAEIRKILEGDKAQTVEAVISSQKLLSTIIRSKNLKTRWAAALFAGAFLSYVAIQGFCSGGCCLPF
ncbi:hypothetical protein [Celeribacter sp.]|uniref:hypothetical protein n=1 Tax=Celeribacter sp. TaxID=1890673 RepID=UPI003A8F9E20